MGDPSTSVPIFVAERVSKRFPGVLALDDVSLRLRPGEVHALVGENGAGKSTLVKIITGVHRPDEGRIMMADQPVDLGSPHEAAKVGIGAVHQERNVVDEFTVAENIMLQRPPSRGGLLDRAAMKTEARKYLDMLELDLDPDRAVAHLSVAQKQLIEIARALSMEPAVLLFDEPTASITPDESERLFRVMDLLRARGTAMVFVSHKLDEVYRVCDTATILRDGRAVVEGVALDSLPQAELINHMVGRTHQAEVLAPRPAPADGVPKLEVRNLHTRFGHLDVSLSVRRGEIVGLYGLVGAGRSELARALLGLDDITGGEVLVDGTPATISSVANALHEHRIGYVTENRKEEGVFLEQTITRNVAVTVWPRIKRGLGIVRESDELDVVNEYVRDLDIKLASPNQLAGQLSGGNQQKVSLAKWLAADCEMLIIDEPTVGIDVRTKGAFHELISQLAADGLAILLISSDLPEMITLADRVLVMRDGMICGDLANTRNYDAMSKQVMQAIHSAGASV